MGSFTSDAPDTRRQAVAEMKTAMDLAEGMRTSIEIVKTVEKLIEKIGMDTLEGMLKEGLPARAFSKLYRSLL